jgi:putative hydrolase of the HAD superfamily
MTSRLPRALLLDLDDTILNDSGNVDECWTNACSAFESELGGIAPAALREAIGRIGNWYWSDPERHRVGRLDLDAARRRIVVMSLADLGSTDDVVAAKIAEAYSRGRDAGIHLFPDAVDTVRWCRAQGCRLALLTNGNAALQRAKVTRFGLTGLFDAILIEGELGFGKPDPRVYERALRDLAVDAAETWMVGDNLVWDVAQPQKMGMVGVWIDLHGRGVPDSVEARPHHVIRALSELRRLFTA